MRKPLRIAFVGWGAISQKVSELLLTRAAEDIAVVAVGLREGSSLPRDLPVGATVVTNPDNLLRLEPDIVVEAAGRNAVEAWGVASVAAGKTFLISSCSALVELGVLTRMVSSAERGGGQIIIPPGALAGIDALAAAAWMQLDDVTHTIIKPPRAWKGTALEKTLDLDQLSERYTFFAGTAREAANLYPQNANSVVTTALAGVGLDKTSVELVVDPAASRNSHRIVAKGEFGALDITLTNEPLPKNPKSSTITALSIVRAIANRARTIAI